MTANPRFGETANLLDCRFAKDSQVDSLSRTCLPANVECTTAKTNLVVIAIGHCRLEIVLAFGNHHAANIRSIGFVQDLYRKRCVTLREFGVGIDASIVLAAIFVVSPDKVLLSVLGALVLNLVLAINHRADRYVGVS